MYTKRDSKIRCHLFSCVAAMIYLRRLEIKLASAGINHTAEDVMDDMQHLHSVLALNKGARKPIRRLEPPTKTQSEVLSALGHLIDGNGDYTLQLPKPTLDKGSRLITAFISETSAIVHIGDSGT